MMTLYKTKNNDYGDSVSDTYNKFGIDAFLVRMYDKLNRLYTLTRPNMTTMVKDEKLTDTLIDLANYAILAVVELESELVELAEGTEKSEIQTLLEDGGIRR